VSDIHTWTNCQYLQNTTVQLAVVRGLGWSLRVYTLDEPERGVNLEVESCLKLVPTESLLGLVEQLPCSHVLSAGGVNHHYHMHTIQHHTQLECSPQDIVECMRDIQTNCMANI
jgi:hypothetical protein